MTDRAIEYYFQILGLPPTASLDDVVKARRLFAQLIHPDVAGDKPGLREFANARMQDINTAHDKLKEWFAAGCPRSKAGAAAKAPDLSDAPDWTVWEESQRQSWGQSAREWQERQHQSQVHNQLEREKKHRAELLHIAKGTLIAFTALIWIFNMSGGLTGGCTAQMQGDAPPPGTIST